MCLSRFQQTFNIKRNERILTKWVSRATDSVPRKHTHGCWHYVHTTCARFVWPFLHLRLVNKQKCKGKKYKMPWIVKIAEKWSRAISSHICNIHGHFWLREICVLRLNSVKILKQSSAVSQEKKCTKQKSKLSSRISLITGVLHYTLYNRRCKLNC